MPGARRIATFRDSTRTSPLHVEKLVEAASKRGVEAKVVNVATREAVFPALEAANRELTLSISSRVRSSLSTYGHSRPRRRTALAGNLPMAGTAEEGGMIGYGPRFVGVFRQHARLVARVLRGARPSEIPVERPTTFELVDNVKAAKAIGHEIPAGFVLRADKLVE